MGALKDILFFVILLGVLIFVHELGHFMWAKIFGVKVFKFSLGFGRRLVGFRRGETEYVVSAIPLGGYVKMLGEGPEGGDGVDATVSDDPEARRPEDAGRALTDKPMWQRAVIIVGGPAMNLLFPILIYFFVFLGRDTILPASVGTVFAGTPAAAAGLQPGDLIVEVDGTTIHGFEDVVAEVEGRPGEPLEFRIRRGDEVFARRITPATAEEVIPIIGFVNEVGRIGVSPYYRAPILGPVEPAADTAAPLDLQPFDEVFALDGRRVRRHIDLERSRVGPDGRLDVGLLRGAPVATGLGTLFVAAAVRQSIRAAPGTPGDRALGATTSDLVVSRVRPGSPGDLGGLRVGDRLLRLDDKPLVTWLDVQLVPERDTAGPHTFLVARDGRELPVTVELHPETWRDPLGQEHHRFSLGVSGYTRSQTDDPVPNPNRVSRAFFGAFDETGNVIRLTALGFAAIFQGRVGVDTIGGPVLIFDVAAQSAEAGAVSFLWAMALISINLGILNLLPIPILDGGQLLFFGIEAIRRKPLSRKFKDRAQFVGLILILALVALALHNDIARRWSDILGLFGCN
ncbi:MAG: site-2 protease family protein [Deltaproteobacteria bacterium]|nr:site-2 protease family protein [Deltaproteobacteria bacterium]